MHVTTLVPPAAEPLGLAEAKDYLRIAGEAQDTQVSAVLAAARARIEEATGLALIVRTLRVTLNHWPAGMLETRILRLPVRPAGELVAVRVYDKAGAAETVTDRFALEPGRPARLIWTGGRFPWPQRRAAGIEVDYTAGFGEAAEDVAGGLRLALKRLAAHAWLARDAGTLAGALPEDVAGLLAPWRRVRL